jgi:hypothetical protein
LGYFDWSIFCGDKYTAYCRNVPVSGTPWYPVHNIKNIIIPERQKVIPVLNVISGLLNTYLSVHLMKKNVPFL